MAAATIMRTELRSDEDIRKDVIAELEWDPRVASNEIGVIVKDSVVTLARSGRTEKTDAEIATAVARALEWDAFVPVDKLDVTVSNGWVTLRGEVEWSRSSWRGCASASRSGASRSR